MGSHSVTRHLKAVKAVGTGPKTVDCWATEPAKDYIEQGIALTGRTLHDWSAACCSLVSYVIYAPRYTRCRQTTDADRRRRPLY